MLALWLRAFVTLLEDPEWIPSAHMMAHNNPYFKPQAI